ncbi:hypothetical protein WJX81_003593 [Elliptochloris bilobata]|uniref:BZIP domain-containing protein n=1 Tax=Elliptochloris bilobata TaxID=381761 RepID=A0AAW1RE04_9CHLO
MCELDAAAVRLLERRVEAARRSGESKQAIQGLLLLLQRVRLEAARGAASPAERLLDDVLRLLDPLQPISDEQGREVEECLERAFRLPGTAVDIFSTAAQLGRGDAGTADADGDAEQADLTFVPREHFVSECRAFIELAQADLRRLEDASSSAHAAEGSPGAEAAEPLQGPKSPQRGSSGSSDKVAARPLGPAEHREEASQGTSSDIPAHQAGKCGALSKCAKEKNRAAQRRFRERQKCLITDLKVRAETLQNECEAQRRRIAELEKENSVLKDIMHRASVDNAAAPTAGAVAAEGGAHLARPADLL